MSAALAYRATIVNEHGRRLTMAFVGLPLAQIFERIDASFPDRRLVCLMCTSRAPVQTPAPGARA